MTATKFGTLDEVRERLGRAGLTAELRLVEGASYLLHRSRAAEAAAQVLAAVEALPST